MTARGIYYRAGYKYQLARDYRLTTGIKGTACRHEFIDLYPDGTLVIRAGYASDGPSGPTIDTRDFMRGAFVHDALYQLMRAGVLDDSCKGAADLLLLSLIREDGMGRLRSWLVFQAVSWRGAHALYPSHDNPVLAAP